jgi:hypothetical protein
VGKAERALFEVLTNGYPKALTKEEIAAESGYSLTSSSFKNALSKLRTLELVWGFDKISASADLFQ